MNKKTLTNTSNCLYAYAIDHAHNVTFKSIGNANLVYSKNSQTDFVDKNYHNPKVA